MILERLPAKHRVAESSEASAFDRPAVASPGATLVRAITLALVVMLLAEVLRVLVGNNGACVVPGRCYRSAQVTPAFLEQMQHLYGIRTVINLRDENVEQTWYQREKQATDRLGIQLANAGLSSVELPPDHDFHHCVRTIATSAEPILIHCASGSDRTGLASAMYLLLRTNASVAEARGQLNLRYGHVSWGKSAVLHRALDAYEAWLEQERLSHRNEHFYRWAMEIYREEMFKG